MRKGAAFNTLRPRQNGRHFPDDIFKCIFLNENAWVSIKISLKFVPKGPINKIPSLVQIMAWRRSGDKPLSEPLMVGLLAHICVTRPQWVNNIEQVLETIDTVLLAFAMDPIDETLFSLLRSQWNGIQSIKLCFNEGIVIDCWYQTYGTRLCSDGKKV